MVKERIAQYFERNPQLHVLFIFDRLDTIASELAGETWPDDYVYKVFDGTWFSTKYHIEHTWKDKKVVLLFPHEMYPANEEKMLQFPLLDLFCANAEYKEDDYEAYIQQYHLPKTVSAYVKRHIGELQTNKLQHLLAPYQTRDAFSEDVCNRAFLTAYLGERQLMDWDSIIARMFILDLPTEEKKRNDFYYKVNHNNDAYKAVQQRLVQLFNIEYEPNSPQRMRKVAECLKYNTITQLLALSPADNYKHYKITDPIQIELINKLYENAIHSNVSEKFLSAIASLGEYIKENTLIELYGSQANYFYMTEPLCWPILKELISNTLIADPTATYERTRNLTLKFSAESPVQPVIQFLSQAAMFYTTMRSTGSLRLNTPDDYIDRYTTLYYKLDTYYRKTLEAYHQLLTMGTPLMQEIEESKTAVDKDYATICNQINLEWLICVDEKGGGLLNTRQPKQDQFYEVNLSGQTKEVVVVCDAFRYEVAMELMQVLKKENVKTSLTTMIANLPTETKYCKTALLPHTTLTLSDNDMLVDGKALSSTEQRTAHLEQYKPGGRCIDYVELMNMGSQAQRDLFKSPLVYIFYNTIDEASHSQSPFEVIRACRIAIEQLTLLIRRLHSSWSVSHVYLTADHGFIYNDMKIEEKDKHSITEETIEQKTRYYLTYSDGKVTGISKYPLDKVSAMTSDKPILVAVPTGTNRFAAPGGYNFAHGGATLQELLIPVIHSAPVREGKTEKVGVLLLNTQVEMISSMLKFQLVQRESISNTRKQRIVLCGIFDGDQLVCTPQEVTLDCPYPEVCPTRLFDVELNVNKPVRGHLLELRIWDKEDELNPLITQTIRNNTLIDRVF